MLGVGLVLQISEAPVEDVLVVPVPGALPVELGALTGHDLPGGPLVTMCGLGGRAASAASVLERAGRHDVSVLAAGPSDWAAGTGRSLEVGA